MRFNIIDGEYNSYEEFVKLYNDWSINTTDIRKKIGVNAFSKFYKEALNKKDITPRPSTLRYTNPIKNYYYDKRMGKYRICKVINKKYIIFGYRDTEEEAKNFVEELKKVNWDKNKLK